ncbi:hypothetical protein [Frondihabitans australicus]|uniref:Uncharacterized protein n=1 Tax=Frondihabitans australicus TaxID=386892 RepID=A0A495II15_9MICO|nr:hypothetical protein [Frondihabitans australicus]RKR74756.1 hypothetical protein C8E83_1885 [Frondihabitans australicus]
MNGKATRQSAPPSRPKKLDMRLTVQEYSLLERGAHRRGLTVSAFTRAVAVDAANTFEGRPPAPETAPVAAVPPLTDEQAAVIAALRVEVMRAGIEVRDVARRAHTDGVDLGELGSAIDALGVWMREVVALLGGRSQP